MDNKEISQIRKQKTKRAKRKADRYLQWAEKAEKKANNLMGESDKITDNIPFGQPVLMGHHSEKRHRRDLERSNNKMDKAMELRDKAKRHREKADNIMYFKTRVKGDAERKRQKIREKNDEKIKVGSIVGDWCYGKGEIIKVNKKTYKIKFNDNFIINRDKSYISL